jgi:CHAT domain-containing protein/Tfp pilus assembly protein PilF
MERTLERKLTGLIILLMVFALPSAIDTRAQTQETAKTSSSREAEIEEARRLMEEVGQLINRGEYDAAMPKAKRALEMRRRIFGPEHPNVAAALNNLAYILFKQNDDSKAQPLYEQALAIFEKTKTESPDAASTLNNFGLLRYRQNDRANAEQLFRRALAMLEKLPQGTERPMAATIMSNLALVFVERGELGPAEQLFRRALSVQEKQFAPDNPALIPTLNYIASTIYQTNHVEAMKLLNRALEIVDKNFKEDPPEALPVISNLVTLYLEEGNYEQAERLAQRNLALVDRNPGNDSYYIAVGYNSVAQVYKLKGDYTKAAALSRRAMETLEAASLTNHPYAADVATNIGLIHMELGEYDQAQEVLQRAKTLREAVFGNRHLNYATSLANLGDLYRRRGEFFRAESMFDEALKIYKESVGEQSAYSAAVMNNLGLLYYAKADLKRAEDLLRQALKIREQLLRPNHQDIAISLVNLANCLMKIGSLDEAEPLLQRALPILEQSRGSEDSTVAQMLNDLGLLHYQRGYSLQDQVAEWQKAESLLQRSLGIQGRIFGKRSLQTMSSVINLALLYQSRGDLNKAEKLYDAFLEISEQSKSQTHPTIARGLENLSAFYVAKGDIARALSAMSRALEIEEYNLNLTLNSGSENQNRNYWLSLYSSTMANISLHTREAPDNQEAARLALTTVLRRKGRVLDSITDSLSTLRERSGPTDKELLDELSTVRRQIAASVSAGPDNLNDKTQLENIARLEEKYQQLQARLSATSAEFRGQSEAVSSESIQQSIPKGAALIEFVSYRPFNAKAVNQEEKWGARHYIAYVLHDDRKIAWVDLGEALPIEDDIWDLRIALRNPAAKNVKLLARKLDQKIMSPVRKLLNRIDWLFVSPDVSLQLLPFEALVDEQGRYLAEKYLFTYLTSGRDLKKFTVAIPSKQPPVIVANPDFNWKAAQSKPSPSASPTLNPVSPGSRGPIYQLLPATETEADQIGKFLARATHLRGSAASEAALKQLHGPSILHIATHGFFPGNIPWASTNPDIQGPQIVKPSFINVLLDLPPSSKDGLEEIRSLSRSGLVLAGANNPENQNGDDGILTAFELGGLDLRGTKLVVLSACETGIGDVESGNGVYGLRRALVLAGAESLVMSLWKVDEKTTRDMMTAFYARLNAGEGTSKALRHVRLEMLRSKRYAHPYFWASFIQSGNWKAINAKLN